MWSFITGQLPYVIRGQDVLPNKQFPTFPPAALPMYVSLAERCLRRDLHERPAFTDIAQGLMIIFSKELGHEGADGVGSPQSTVLSGDGMYTTSGSPSGPSEPEWDYMPPMDFSASRCLLASSLLGPSAVHPDPSSVTPAQQQQLQ